MKIKKIISIFLYISIIIIPLNLISFAEEPDLLDIIYTKESQKNITPISVFILNCSCRISASDGNIKINASVVGKSSVNKTSIIIKLQELKSEHWVDIKTSSKKIGGKTCSSSNSYSVSENHTYRAMVIVSAGNETKMLVSTSQKY
ncbi:hypothetical protein [Clostridioides difficile]|uniref:hypothetical protein n=1 Tax=Clostridioides difficile TaxID=1496 RepID=UPI001C19EB83|nr:hypothetical protein [Clostridioides difficile]MDF3817604.1 hypothetical protein [Clostridioides difficile]HBF4283312.1 hypothetical protein [Clostridioides difficile]HBF5048837.1 hypothetical protein [Clostridioides difficile]HBF5114730.1 hypothetical protein [Clostridioides difficile]HBF5876672.1 hypothetical protein [Clostridioides difficile]